MRGRDLGAPLRCIIVMRKTVFSLLMLTIFGVNAKETPKFGHVPVEEVVRAMTLEEKVNLVVGTLRDYVYRPDAAPGMPERVQGEVDDARGATAHSDGRVPGAAGETYAIPRLGIPSIVMADGPAGVRIDPTREGREESYFCTAFPTGTLLASSWNTGLVENVGAAIGNEALHYGVDILLAPGVNIMRNPLCGRNFEYYSEDPLLAGKMAAAYVRGVQSNGVGATVKHFAANNQETMRNGIDVVISDRALRDIYLEPFRIAVTEARPMAVMSAYNKVNGVIMPENKYLLTDVLRDEWGFDGFVMTDWWAEGNGAVQTAAGNDMLMPGTWRQYDEIMNAIADGSLDESLLDRNVANILRAIEKTPVGMRRRYDDKPDLEKHASLARQTAADGIVLLENNNGTLPLTPGLGVALFGNASYDTFVGGTGSGNVNRAYKINIDEGLASDYIVNPDLKEFYLQKIKSYKSDKPADDMWTTLSVPEELVPLEMIEKAAKESTVAVLTISRMAGEGADRTITEGDWFLSRQERENLENITRIFHNQGKKVIVLLNMGSIVDMEDWKDLPDAILHVWLPGQEAGNAISDVISGTVNPSGRLPMTIARKYEDYGSASAFPHSENPATVYYSDDIFVGYRHFDYKGIEPLYPFGYGLSYTDFSVTILEKTDDETAVVEVTNVGICPGPHVVILFDEPGSPVAHIVKTETGAVTPPRSLKGFAKTPVLHPGETTRLIIPLY